MLKYFCICSSRPPQTDVPLAPLSWSNDLLTSPLTIVHDVIGLTGGFLGATCLLAALDDVLSV